MQKTILIARDLKTGQDVILCGSEVPYPKQVAAYEEVIKSSSGGLTHEQYSGAGLYYLEPAKRVLQFITPTQAAERNANHEKQIAPKKPKA